jgi:hypothetical protein
MVRRDADAVDVGMDILDRPPERKLGAFGAGSR